MCNDWQAISIRYAPAEPPRHQARSSPRKNLLVISYDWKTKINVKLTFRSPYPFVPSPRSMATQRHLEELTSNDTCGLLYYSEDYINGSIGETLFMCYTGNETYDCYTPAFAMEYMCEFLLCGCKRNRQTFPLLLCVLEPHGRRGETVAIAVAHPLIFGIQGTQVVRLVPPSTVFCAVVERYH